MADEPGYQLQVGTELRGTTLAIAPTITAPAGKALRYDVTTRKSGVSGSSNTRQGGNVVVGPDGTASLSKVSVSVYNEDRCEVSVEVYDGSKLVASRRVVHP